MNSHQQDILNVFFVETFNKILALEERFISKQSVSELSVRELHVLEAVCDLEKTSSSTMSKTAQRLSITIGALTTAVNVLVKKGYLKRGRDVKDRRIVYLFLTEKGKEAEKAHQLFHQQMISNVADSLSKEALDTLIASLEKLSNFFDAQTK